MAVSLATRLTPYMGSGDAPRVVIRGHFVLGAAMASRGGWGVGDPPYLEEMYPALWLCTRGAATAWPGNAIGVHVSGRHDSLSGDYTAANLQELAIPSEASASSTSVNTDYPGLVRVMLVPSDQDPLGVYSTSSSTNGPSLEAQLKNYNAWTRAYLGVCVAQNLVIELTGRLATLDLDALGAAAFFRRQYYDSSTHTELTADGRSLIGIRNFSDRVYGEGDAGYKQAGWFLGSVDIYDQQQLRGHVTGGGGKVTWR